MQPAAAAPAAAAAAAGVLPAAAAGLAQRVLRVRDKIDAVLDKHLAGKLRTKEPHILGAKEQRPHAGKETSSRAFLRSFGQNLDSARPTQPRKKKNYDDREEGAG
jgi:hypothetical protein